MVKIKKKQEDRKIETIENISEESPVVERALCLCFARIHKLIANCQSCGKVICEKEGLPDCLFCHQPIEEIEEDDLIATAYFEKAVYHKEQLLEFQASKIAKKNIIDDQNDWYDLKTNVWEDKAVRKLADEKLEKTQNSEEQQKQFIVYDLDMSSGKVEGRETTADYGNEREQVQKFMEEMENYKKQPKPFIESKINDDVLREAVKNVKQDMDKKREGHVEDAWRPTGSRIVQNDNAYDVLLAFNKNMQAGKNNV